MCRYLLEFIALGIKYTICLLLAAHFMWLIQWQQPSIDDIINFKVMRILIGLWIFSALGAFWIARK